MSLELAISLIALAVSSIVALWQIRLQSRLTEIEEERRDEEREARSKADVVARLRWEGVANRRQRLLLVISDEGQAEARDVNIQGETAWAIVDANHHLPLQSLQPGQSYELRLERGSDNLKTYKLSVTWSDLSGGFVRSYRLSAA